MMKIWKRYRWPIRAAILCSVIGIGVGVALAEDIWVNRPEAPIRSGKLSMFPIVATAVQGDKLTVIERDGNWVHVQYGNVDGWLSADGLSSRQVGGDMFAGAHDTTGTNMSQAGMSKGFTAEEFATKEGLDPKPFATMEANVKANVTPDGLIKFMADGKVGLSKGN